MLVGEAPGADEQRAGRPFVGMSGHMVDVQLRINGLTRDEVYITNVVKWRPVNRYGQNRKPTPSEIADSIDCVMEEITCINPDVLVTLGAVPLSLFSTAPISACHGRSEQIMLGANPVSLLPMYHPAYIARQRQLEKSYVQEWTVLSQYKSSP
jgi:DNA polymerase